MFSHLLQSRRWVILQNIPDASVILFLLSYRWLTSSEIYDCRYLYIHALISNYPWFLLLSSIEDTTFFLCISNPNWDNIASNKCLPFMTSSYRRMIQISFLHSNFDGISSSYLLPSRIYWHQYRRIDEISFGVYTCFIHGIIALSNVLRNTKYPDIYSSLSSWWWRKWVLINYKRTSWLTKLTDLLNN